MGVTLVVAQLPIPAPHLPEKPRQRDATRPSRVLMDKAAAPRPGVLRGVTVSEIELNEAPWQLRKPEAGATVASRLITRAKSVREEQKHPDRFVVVVAKREPHKRISCRHVRQGSRIIRCSAIEHT